MLHLSIVVVADARFGYYDKLQQNIDHQRVTAQACDILNTNNQSNQP